MKCFFALAAFWCVQVIAIYPEMYMWERDDAAIYYLVTRGIPDFWHSYLTSALYLGALKAFWHPIALPMLQAICLSAGVAWLFTLICSLTENKVLRFGIVFLSLESCAWHMFIMPYRNSIYTILLFLLFLWLLNAYLSGKNFSVVELVMIGLCSGILAFWRSEGLLLMVLIPALILCIEKKQRRKAVLIIEMIAIISYLVVSYPQRQATQKYFGKDYMMVNVIGMVSDVLLSDDHNSDYPEYEHDIDTISSLYDIDEIKAFQSVAFQIENFRHGRNPSRSQASPDEQKRFMKAATSLLLHNKRLFLAGRLRLMGEALGFLPKYQLNTDVVTMTNEELESINQRLGKMSELGKEQLTGQMLLPYDVHKAILGGWQKVKSVYSRAAEPLFTAGWVLLTVFVLMLLLEGIVYQKWFFVFTYLYAFALSGAVIVFSPQARETYYYPVYYLSVGCALSHLALSTQKNAYTINGNGQGGDQDSEAVRKQVAFHSDNVIAGSDGDHTSV